MHAATGYHWLLVVGYRLLLAIIGYCSLGIFVRQREPAQNLYTVYRGKVRHTTFVHAAIGFWLLGTGYWLRYWLLGIDYGYCLLPIG